VTFVSRAIGQDPIFERSRTRRVRYRHGLLIRSPSWCRNHPTIKIRGSHNQSCANYRASSLPCACTRPSRTNQRTPARTHAFHKSS
jgi:hypothetical protein